MNYHVFLSRRRNGALAIIGLFAIQSLFGLLCGSLLGFWQATLVLVAPLALLLLVSGSTAALSAGGILVPFILFANTAECAPYRGGGAAMGYVPAFIFGLPLSVITGVVVAIFVFIRERKSKHEH